MKTLACFLLSLVLLNAVLCVFCSPTTYTAKAEAVEPLFARHRVRYTDTPSVWVFIEVINNGTKAVKNVNVTVSFYDDQGYMIEQITRKTIFNVIMPQRRAPVAASISDESALRYGATGRYEVSIVNYEDSEDIEKGIMVIPESTYLTESNVSVAGRVYNNCSTALRIIQVVALFYDENGIFAYSEPFPYMLSSPVQPQNEVPDAFELYSEAVNNASKKLACIITAEAPDRLGNQTQKAATVDQETLFWIKGGPESPIESFDLRWIVLVLVVGAAVIVGVVALRRRREAKRSRWTKSQGKNVAPTRIRTFSVTDNLLFSTMVVFISEARGVYLGLRG